MKILFTNFHQEYGGGHDTYLYTLCASLVNDHSITVAIPHSSFLAKKLQTLPSVKIISFLYKIRIYKLISLFKQILNIRKLLKNERYDIIHVNGSRDHSLIILATLFLKNRPPIVFTKHNSIKIKWSAKIRCRFFTDAIIAV